MRCMIFLYTTKNTSERVSSHAVADGLWATSCNIFHDSETCLAHAFEVKALVFTSQPSGLRWEGTMVWCRLALGGDAERFFGALLVIMFRPVAAHSAGRDVVASSSMNHRAADNGAATAACGAVLLRA